MKKAQPIVMVDPALIDEVEGANPNRMDAETEAELERSMRRLGFRQAVSLVRKPGGRYWVSDGVHRLGVALKLGINPIPALLADGTEVEVRAERLALNRIRGAVDLGAAADELRALQDAGWSADDLGACGFSEDELGALLAARDDGQGLVEEAEGPLSDGSDVQRQKRYSLSLVFDREADRDRAKLALLEAGATAEAGLLALIS